MRLNWKVLTPWLISVVLFGLLVMRNNETIVVKVPSRSGGFDWVAPEPEKTGVPDKKTVEEFAEKDDPAKVEAYKKAITPRTYKKEFVDKVQTITATVKTVGTLEDLQIEYKTNPIEKEVKIKGRPHLYLGGGLSFPNSVPTYEVRGNLTINKTLISIGYDFRNRTTTFGAAFRIF